MIEPMRKMIKAISLSQAVGLADTPKGRALLKQFLASEPFPHFEQHPTVPGALIRIDQDGTRTAGSFINRDFVPMKKKARHSLRASKNP